MNAFSLKACGRILWREAAEQYAFCIGIFALLVTMQASLATMDTFDMIPAPTVAFGFGMALFMTAIYVAGSCALLLTAEVDAGTFSFQRTKPIGWFTYLWGKLAWVLFSGLLLGLVAWLETGVWLGRFPGVRDTSLAMGVCGVGILEGMAWGLMASMLVREPLRAVIAGIAMASLGAWLTVVVHHTATGGGIVAVSAAYYDAAGPRLIVAVVALAIAISLVRVWYRTGQPLRLIGLPGTARGRSQTIAVAGEWDSYSSPRRGRTRRLIWHAWRQIRTATIICWALCLAVVAAAAYRYSQLVSQGSASEDDLAGLITIVSVPIVVLSSLLAGYTFGADQKARFLQLARDGVSPWEIWLSRLMVMGAILLLPAIAVLGLLWFATDHYELRVLRPLVFLLVALGYVSVLAIGQACSMYVRSRIIALLAAPVMTACFAFWIGMGVFFLGLGWKMGVTPLLLALLIGSRMLAGTRLRQHNSWRAMRVPVLLIVAAVVVTYQALAYHRVSEVRPYDSIAQVIEPFVALRPRAAVEYARSLGARSSGASPREQIKQALSFGGCAAAPFQANVIRGVWHENSRSLFVRRNSYGYMLLTDAKLNHTLREVTSRPGIGNEKLRVCIDFLEDWGSQRPRHAEWLAVDCQRDMAWLQLGPAPEYAGYGIHGEPLPWRYRWLWYERTRALQLLDRTYRIAADRAEAEETALINDQLGNPFEQRQQGEGLVSWQDILPYDPSRSIWYQASNQALLGSRSLRRFRLINSLEQSQWNRYDSLYTAEAQRRGTILYLALRMYYNDHGELPESLDALVEGKYLTRLPLVPIACEPFHYEPTAASEQMNKTIERLNGFYTNMYWPGGMDASFLFEHDSTLPFVWYPFGPSRKVNPGTSSGLFIDLDFVKDKESE